MTRTPSKAALLSAVVLALACTPAAGANAQLDAELSWVMPGYNDVAIPGSSGSRVSLTEDFKADAFAGFRLRYLHPLSEKHAVGLLAAPLTMDSIGTAARDIDFNGETFQSGSRIRTSFRFDSYRVIYRYHWIESPRLRVHIGGALKLRDAAIRMKSAALESTKSNTGIVPLASFHFGWQATDRLQLIIDGEALAAPQGRAEDVLFAVQYRASPSAAVHLGYRILEGGADNDEVYTFSLFHQIALGLSWRFGAGDAGN